MASKLYMRVGAILLVSLVTTFVVFYTKQWFYAVPGIFLLLWQTNRLLFMVNRTNRELAFFFDAIRNEDSTLHFPLKTRNPGIDSLHDSMNRLNGLISEAKLQNRLQEQYYETILEHAATGLMSFDERGHVLMSNTAARRLLGCEPLTHLHQLDRIEHGLGAELAGMIAGGQKLLKISHERGSQQLAVRAASMVLKNKNLTLLSIQDIRNELDEKETESWIRLIRVLTHEIMNSIAPITSLSETMAGYFESGKQARKREEIDDQVIANTIRGLSVIRERGAGLINFVDSYRKLTHLPNPHRSVVDVQLFFDKVKMLLFSDLNFGQTRIEFRLLKSDLSLYVDENLFSQVIINLVRNSVEALKNQDNAEIIIQAGQTDGDQVQIRVIDNGPGISPELLDKIFIPFFTTREHGSGIGLSLSRQIMRLHGGSISVQSRPGNTCFELVV